MPPSNLTSFLDGVALTLILFLVFINKRIKKLMWWKPYHVKPLCYLCKNPLKGQISWGIDIKDDNFTRHYFVCGLCNKIINK